MILAFAVVAALIAGIYLWSARPRPQAVATPAGGPSSVAATPVPPVASASASTGSVVVVHVHGKVRHPGVVTLPGGSRVADAIKAAGGARTGVGTGSLNLARTVVDGEQIPVGVKAPASSAASAPGAAPPSSAGGPGPGPGGSAPGAPGTPLDLNAATVEQLDQLPGVGPVLAQRIVDYRTQHGGFRSVEQLQEVSGIGARRFSDLKAMVRV